MKPSTRFQKNEHSAGRILGALICAILLALARCSGSFDQTDRADTRRKMSQAQASMTRLWSAIWESDAAKDEKSSREMLQLTDQLIDEFHEVDKLSSRFGMDPSFPIILENEAATLHEIRDEIAKNNIDSARSRFRSLIGNCIACHSRYAARTSFMGNPPPETGTSFQERYTAAEYLFATRQFDKADEALFQLARTVPAGPIASESAMRAIKLWLVLQIRVKNQPAKAAERLEKALPALSLNQHDGVLVKDWIWALREIAKNRDEARDELSEARYWLGSNIAKRPFEDDERLLPQTIYATAILHRFVSENKPEASRREAVYLLALAYNHLPVEFLSASRDEYFAAVIMEFPKTPEAAEAFRMFEDFQKSVHGHDERGQIALSEIGKRRLEHLRLLATP